MNTPEYPPRHIPDAEPQDETAKLRERIAELEREYAAVRESLESQQRVFRQDNEMLEERLHAARKELATALTPRPIAEAGPVPEGFRRWYMELRGSKDYAYGITPYESDTHFLDIKLPSPDPRAEYERAVAEAGGAFEAWLQAKGGAQ